VRCGFKTQAEVVAEQGGDLEELLVARKAEVDRAEELDLYFDTNPENEHEQTENPALESTEAAQETADNMDENQIADESDGPIA
jgi:capsid protein